MTVTVDEINAFLLDAWAGSVNECVEVGPDWAVARHVVVPEAIRPGGYISGPTQFGLADAALWYALFGAVGIEPMAVTSELSIRFLRPAMGAVLMARADLHIIGRRNVVGDVRLWMDGAPERTVSVAQGSYVRPVPSAGA
jgi:acyl-coenzyme A thioesterase PaaI-like protein